MIDCRTYKISNIAPLRGQVLLEIQPPTLAGPLVYPEATAERIGMGVLVDPGEKPTPQEAIVRKFGAPDERAPYEFGLGDRVIVRRNAGRTVNQPPFEFKLVKAKDVLAVFV